MKDHYTKVNETIGKWVGYSFNVMLKLVTPIVLLPPICISFYKYFYLNLGENSFQLIFPAS